MRRRETAADRVPARLVTFTPADWPGDTQAAFKAWKRARREWAAAHGAALDDVAEAAQTPDAPWDPDLI